MAADDVARALMAMDDDGLRHAVADGDRSPLAGFALTEEEIDLVVSAARDDREVTGHAVGPSCVIYPWNAHVGLGAAVAYVEQRPAQSEFSDWASIKRANGGW